MHFDTRDIRNGMDVFTADNIYLGSVVELPPATSRVGPEPVAEPGSSVSGASLGPMPTQEIGNRGPRSQSAGQNFATMPDAEGVYASGSFVVGKWFGLLARKRIAVDFVQAVSAERIVLRLSDREVG